MGEERPQAVVAVTRRLAVLGLAALAALAVAAGVRAAPPVVYLGSDSQTFTQAQLAATLPAYQTMVSRDLAAWWGVDAVLTTDPALEASAAMALYVTDQPGPFGAEGMHDVLAGRPTAWVFADVCETFLEAVPLVVTHELQEMLVDPWINHFAFWDRRAWLVEVADPVEDGMYAYWIDGVPISDFITPAWYGTVRGQPVDFAHRLKRPGQLGRNGYASWKDRDGNWQQIFAS